MKLGLIGKSLSHSASKPIHELYFDITQQKASYDLFEIEDERYIKNRLNMFEKMDFTGINVTIPYKQIIMEHLDDISEEASNIGAVNTVLFKDGKKHGYNTDYFGFQQTLTKHQIDTSSGLWLVLGYGGAARSVIAVLKDLDTQYLCVSTKAKGRDFITYEQVKDLPVIDGIINTTPVGMYPKTNECVLSKELVQRAKWVIDLIYNPVETLMLRYAKEANIPHVNGLYMLVAQAMRSQSIWHDQLVEDLIIEEIYQKIKKEKKQCPSSH